MKEEKKRENLLHLEEEEEEGSSCSQRRRDRVFLLLLDGRLFVLMETPLRLALSPLLLNKIEENSRLLLPGLEEEEEGSAS